MISELVTRARSDHNTLYRNAVYLILSPLTMGGLGFGFWLLAGRYFSAEQVGLSAAIVQFTTFIITLALVGQTSVLIRFLPGHKSPDNLLWTSMVVPLAALVVLAVPAVLLFTLWVPEGTDGFPVNLWFLIAALAVGSVLWDMTEAVYIAHRIARYALVKNLLFSVLRVGFLAFAVVVGGDRYGILWAWSLAIGLGLAFAFGYQFRRLGLLRRTATLKIGLVWQHRRFALANYAVHTFQHAGILLMPALVVAMLGAEQGAYFYIPWMIGAFLLAVPDSMAMSLFAEGANFQEKLRENVRKAIRFCAVTVIPGSAILVLSARYVLGLFDQQYADEGWTTLVILAVSSLPFAVVVIHKAVLRVQQRNVELALMWIFLTAVLFTGSVMHMPTVGIEAVALSWLAANCFLAAWILMFRRGVYHGHC